jgi:hypothetical protein
LSGRSVASGCTSISVALVRDGDAAEGGVMYSGDGEGNSSLLVVTVSPKSLNNDGNEFLSATMFCFNSLEWFCKCPHQLVCKRE